MSSVVSPLSHTYVYGAVPPLTVKSADPELSPKHEASLATAEAVSSVGSPTVALAEAVHPLAYSYCISTCY